MEPSQIILLVLATILAVALVVLGVYLFVKTVIFIVETPRQLERIADALEQGTDDEDEDEKGQS